MTGIGAALSLQSTLTFIFSNKANLVKIKQKDDWHNII